MITVSKPFVLALASFLCMLPRGGRAASPSSTDSPPTGTLATVERVVDGDTVVVRLDGRSVKVRLVGVDAPESVDPRKPIERFARESAAFLRGLVEGKTVRLAYEPAGARIDRYGRTLAYLYVEPGGLFVNREIIAKGFGHAYTTYPFAHMEDFRAAERSAREKGLGLWGPDPAPAKPTADEVVYVTKTGTKYHRAGCRALAKSATAIRLAEVAGNYEPCRVCDPPPGR
jgi:micrococcal nuclease